MFSWFHKKNTSSTVAETLINSDSCSQSFEHSTLSKIHELQTERDNINNELKELNNTNSLETPEFDKYAQHLATHMSKDFKTSDENSRLLVSEMKVGLVLYSHNKMRL